MLPGWQKDCRTRTQLCLNINMVSDPSINLLSATHPGHGSRDVHTSLSPVTSSRSEIHVLDLSSGLLPVN